MGEEGQGLCLQLGLMPSLKLATSGVCTGTSGPGEEEGCVGSAPV